MVSCRTILINFRLGLVFFSDLTLSCRSKLIILFSSPLPTPNITFRIFHPSSNNTFRVFPLHTPITFFLHTTTPTNSFPPSNVCYYVTSFTPSTIYRRGLQLFVAAILAYTLYARSVGINLVSCKWLATWWLIAVVWHNCIFVISKLVALHYVQYQVDKKNYSLNTCFHNNL